MNLSILAMVMVSWNQVEDYFGGLTEALFQNHLVLAGLVIFLFFLMFGLIILRGVLSLLVIPMIPLVFYLASEFALQDLMLIVGIIVGILFGFALVKWYKR